MTEKKLICAKIAEIYRAIDKNVDNENDFP